MTQNEEVSKTLNILLMCLIEYLKQVHTNMND
jgi:hypothetical protein